VGVSPGGLGPELGRWMRRQEGKGSSVPFSVFLCAVQPEARTAHRKQCTVNPADCGQCRASGEQRTEKSAHCALFALRGERNASIARSEYSTECSERSELSELVCGQTDAARVAPFHLGLAGLPVRPLSTKKAASGHQAATKRPASAPEAPQTSSARTSGPKYELWRAREPAGDLGAQASIWADNKS